MTRNLALTALVVVVASSAVAADPAPKKPAEALPDYSSWKALTAQPIKVDPSVFTRCAGPLPSTRAAMKARGPHFVPSVKFFANPSAAEAIQSEAKKAMPVGATIVKEKYDNAEEAKPSAYAAMIKREPGYDAEHGDWEYLYVELGGEKPVVTRGAIKSCVQCHSIAMEKDYLFRTYLPKPVAKGNGQ